MLSHEDPNFLNRVAEDALKIFELGATAKIENIDRAFRKKALESHSDKGGKDFPLLQAGKNYLYLFYEYKDKEKQYLKETSIISAFQMEQEIELLKVRNASKTKIPSPRHGRVIGIRP